MFYIIQAGSTLQVMQTDGTVQTLTLPTGVTIDATVKGVFAVLAQQVLFANAPTLTLWVDPYDLSVRPMSIVPPMSAPTVAAGSSTGLTGVYRVKVSYYVKDLSGTVVNESPLSSPSLQVTLANQDLSTTDIPVSPDAALYTASQYIFGRRLYRTVAGGADVYFQWLDIDDNTTTAVANGLPDASLELLPSDPLLGNPPGTINGTRLTLLTTWKNRLWARSGAFEEQDDIRYSDDNRFYAWSPDNSYPAYPKGEDQYGITGYIPRRDELGVCKRSRILKVVGNDFDPVTGDGQVIIVAEGVGCIAPASIVVIRDVGYFLGPDGVYTFGPDGVQPISRAKVDPWFTTDTYFNRTQFVNAVGSYNAKQDSYELQLAAAGSTNLDRWVSYDTQRQEWLGPHLTSKFTPTTRAELRDANGVPLPVLGSSDGYVYKENQAGASDQGTGIAIDWVTKYFSASAPDITHFWDQATVFNKIQAAGTLVVTPKVGALGAADGTAQNIPQTVDRTRLARFGVGRLLRLQFTHSTDGQDIVLYGFELPFNEVGRR